MGAVASCGGRESSSDLWRRAMLEMSMNTRDLVVRAGRKIESKQMGEKEAHAWMLGRLKSIRLLTDRILEELYAKYDTNNDGTLSKDEFRELVEEYLVNGRNESKAEVARLVRYQFEMQELSPEQIDAKFADPKIKAKIADAEANVEKAFEQWLAQKDAVTDEMYQKLESNLDGSIDRQEFIMSFPHVCEEVCDTTSLKTTLVTIANDTEKAASVEEIK